MALGRGLSRELKIFISGDASSLQKAMGGAESSVHRAGGKFDALGRTLKVGLGVGLGAAGAAAGFALKAFSDFDSGLDAVRITSGKTGPELARLQGSFRSVNRTVVAAEEDVGTAIGQLSQRLGIHGTDLEKLARQELELARITKSDLGDTIDTTTRLFGDWAVATDKQSDSLDFLFRVSQKTATPVADLSRLLVQYGAPLRQLGFGLNESATLLGKWQQEGVNTELVAGSLRIALGRLAQDGVEASKMPEVFRAKLEEIRTSADPVTKAIELFGARAGPDMAAAILEGRFQLDQLVKDLDASKDTIFKAGDESEDFQEKFAKAMKVAKEGAATFITPTLDLLTEKLGGVNDSAGISAEKLDAIKKAGEGLAKGIEIAAGTVANFVEGWEVLGELSVKWEGRLQALARVLEIMVFPLRVLATVAGMDFSDLENRNFSNPRGRSGGGGGGGGGSGTTSSGSGGGGGGGSLNMFAQGGIVDRPTFAMVGEDGAEAIVPLTKPHRAQEVLRQAGLIDERPASRDTLRAQGIAHLGRSLTPSGTQPIAPSVVQPATRSASAPVYISVTVNGSVTTERQLVDAIHEGLLRKQSRQDSLAFK